MLERSPWVSRLRLLRVVRSTRSPSRALPLRSPAYSAGIDRLVVTIAIVARSHHSGRLRRSYTNADYCKRPHNASVANVVHLAELWRREWVDAMSSKYVLAGENDVVSRSVGSGREAANCSVRCRLTRDLPRG